MSQFQLNVQKKNAQNMEMLFGFMPNLEYVYQILTFQFNTKKYMTIKTYCVYAYLEKAYDKVNRLKLWKFNTTMELKNEISLLYDRNETYVRINVMHSKWFNIKQVVKESVILMFNTLMDKYMCGDVTGFFAWDSFSFSLCVCVGVSVAK